MSLCLQCGRSDGHTLTCPNVPADARRVPYTEVVLELPPQHKEPSPEVRREFEARALAVAALERFERKLLKGTSTELTDAERVSTLMLLEAIFGAALAAGEEPPQQQPPQPQPQPPHRLIVSPDLQLVWCSCGQFAKVKTTADGPGRVYYCAAEHAAPLVIP